MQLYPGLAPLTVNTSGSGSPGVLVSSGSADPHGAFPTPNEMVGGDPRLAAQLMAAVESLTSRTNWLGWHTLDIFAGGDYSLAGSNQITTANAWGFKGSVGFTNASNFVANGATLYVGYAIIGAGHIVVSSNGDITVDGAATYASGSATNVQSGAVWTFAPGSTVTTSSPLIHLGVTAVSVLREVVATSIVVTAGGSGGHLVINADNTFDPSQADFITTTFSAVSATRTWTLTHPPSGDSCIVNLYQNGTWSGGGGIQLADASTGNIVNGLLDTGTWTPGGALRLWYSPSLASWVVLV